MTASEMHTANTEMSNQMKSELDGYQEFDLLCTSFAEYDLHVRPASIHHRSVHVSPPASQSKICCNTALFPSSWLSQSVQGDVIPFLWIS
jgi:hypothetical protein